MSAEGIRKRSSIIKSIKLKFGMENLGIKKNSPEAALGLLLSVALVDNHYSSEEKIIIYKLCDSYNYPQDKLEKLVKQIQYLECSVFDTSEYIIKFIEDEKLKEK